MSIILQSTVGGFSAQFMRKLPLVEQAMRDHGLDPSEFVISKDYASTATIPIMARDPSLNTPSISATSISPSPNLMTSRSRTTSASACVAADDGELK